MLGTILCVLYTIRHLMVLKTIKNNHVHWAPSEGLQLQYFICGLTDVIIPATKKVTGIWKNKFISHSSYCTSLKD